MIGRLFYHFSTELELKEGEEKKKWQMEDKRLTSYTDNHLAGDSKKTESLPEDLVKEELRPSNESQKMQSDRKLADEFGQEK